MGARSSSNSSAAAVAEAGCPESLEEEAKEHPQLQFLSGQLPGQDKWLGGALGSDGCIYGIPGTARQVLRVDPRSGEVATFGPEFPGRYKWLRGVEAPDGCIYAIPANADRVLQIRPPGAGGNTKSVTDAVLIGPTFPGKWKWHGGVLAGDGRIYGIPCNAESVLRITPDGAATEVCTIGGPLPGRQKWYGGLLSKATGQIFGIPNCADGVIRITPTTGEVDVIGTLPAGGWKWHGGVVGDDGVIYGIPAHADRVLKVVPESGEVSIMGGAPLSAGEYRPDGRFKWGGGCVGPGGLIYCFPSDADQVLRIDTGRGEASLIGPSYVGPHNKWQNGFLAADRCVYAIPCNAPGVLRISPDGEVSTIGGPWPGADKWEGGVVGHDGVLYCMPQRAKSVLTVSSGALVPFPLPVAVTSEVEAAAGAAQHSAP